MGRNNWSGDIRNHELSWEINKKIFDMAATKFKPSISFHPGVTLSEKLKELDINVKEFALLTSLSLDTIQGIIDGDISVTSDIAIVFEQITHIPAHFWLNKQHNYDASKGRNRKEVAASSFPPIRWRPSLLLDK